MNKLKKILYSRYLHEGEVLTAWLCFTACVAFTLITALTWQ